MQKLKEYQQQIVDYLNEIFSGYKPEVEKLYEPVFYALEGGKKIRPVSVLLVADVFGGDLKQALIPAFSLEMFHNFTLLHDDVMDNSPVRRNRPTIQAKWSPNQAILSGDAMMVLVYQKLLELPENMLVPVMKLINKTALQVCEGQQLDMDFEERDEIKIDEYLQMIRLKTAVLLAASLSMGALISGASQPDIERIYDFGINLGLAFQIQDDYFDAFADFETFGKKIGNDIITDKKTFLTVKAFETADEQSRTELKKLFSGEKIDDNEKIMRVTAIYRKLGIDKIALAEVNKFYEKALKSIETLDNAGKNKKQYLYDFAEYILKRKK